MQDLKFNAEIHEYTVDGIIIPSVTQVLKATGIISEYLCADFYRDRGSAVHHLSNMYIQGALCLEFGDDDYLAQYEHVDWSDCVGYVRTFSEIVDRLGLSYISSEQPCYDTEYKIGGTYDLIVGWEGKRALVELKSGEFPMWGGLQLASYERMVDVDTVIGISLKDQGKVYVPSDDWYMNHDTLKDIHDGWFVLNDWKSDRKRRRMQLLK